MVVYIVVNIAEQQLLLKDDKSREIKKYSVSTASNGPGQMFGSECTPLGEHQIRAMIGHDSPINTVFVGRRPTGEIYSEQLAAKNPERDWILTRIMWLSGMEPGYNRLGACDSFRRYIYIHGCPDSHEMGQPSSHGCIKMRNTEVIELFERVAVGDRVSIVAN